MNKNVIFVYGKADARRVLISDLKKEEQGDTIYLVIDVLNRSLGITSEDGMGFPIRLQSLISRSSYISSSMLNVLFKYNPKLKCFPGTTEYLLKSWLNFIFKNTEKLSIYNRWDKHINSKKDSKNEIKQYVTEILNKNSKFSFRPDNDFYNVGCFDDNDMKAISGFMGKYRKGDNQDYKVSDIKLLKKLEEIDRSESRRSTEVEYDGLDPHTNHLLSSALEMGMMRKLSKLSLEWIKEESVKPDSPIKGWIFLMNYLDNNTETRKQETRTRVDNEIDQPKLWKGKKTFSNGSVYSPITDSEYRHVRRKFLHETGTEPLMPSSEESKSKIKSGIFNLEFYPNNLLKRGK
ncbi:hypothetical protein [Xenorhabdus innexi]|uniref:Uncharacterized protein n=1 Tax=Xenorhabdus innexi TaxID=290109 RepID=A0A1N6MR56_9GAMM|nr:hypothetical protein [Xenorhabdus innexi]PHM35655.1 hypothetical protein Xinn_02219 [Xenorhabdus innexi]SIP71333.1 hypothetical protein XIS1_1120037 [Xenorhabdus innexi]